jgi:hypothetical protein
MNATNPISRRDVLKRLVLLCGAAGALVTAADARAAELPHLTPDDPTAKALGYHDDAKAVDAKQFATYQAGQACNTCLQLQGAADQPWRPCSIFPGKAVNAGGWCRSWAKRA